MADLMIGAALWNARQTGSTAAPVEVPRVGH
jgi:hypothetical protein